MARWLGFRIPGFVSMATIVPNTQHHTMVTKVGTTIQSICCKLHPLIFKISSWNNSCNVPYVKQFWCTHHTSVHNSAIRESGYMYMQRLTLQVFTDGDHWPAHTYIRTLLVVQTFSLPLSSITIPYIVLFLHTSRWPLPFFPPPPPLLLHLTSGVPHCPRRSQIVTVAVLDIVFVLLQPRELGGVINEQGLLTLNCDLTDR